MSCSEIGRITAQLSKDHCRIPVNRVPDHRTGPSAGRCEVPNSTLGGVGGGESLSDRGATDIACADEQDVQDCLLMPFSSRNPLQVSVRSACRDLTSIMELIVSRPINGQSVRIRDMWFPRESSRYPVPGRGAALFTGYGGFA